MWDESDGTWKCVRWSVPYAKALLEELYRSGRTRECIIYVRWRMLPKAVQPASGQFISWRNRLLILYLCKHLTAIQMKCGWEGESASAFRQKTKNVWGETMRSRFFWWGERLLPQSPLLCGPRCNWQGNVADAKQRRNDLIALDVSGKGGGGRGRRDAVKGCHQQP